MDAMNINDWGKLSAEALVDLYGVLHYEEKQRADRKKEIGKELMKRGVLPLDGAAFHAQVVEATTAWFVDRAAVEKAMGEEWTIQHSKPVTRGAYILSKPLASAAAKAAA